MKKNLSILLIFFLTICLCACSGTSVGTAETRESGSTATSGENPAVTIPPTAIRLKVSFGPEFELVMTDYLRILMVNPANEDAEELLAGLELADRFYCFAFEEILAAAQEQEYLKIGNTIKMTADSQAASVWTNASYELLMRPVEAFRKESGAIFGCYLSLPDTAPEQFDASQYTRVERTTEEFHLVQYPTGAVSGHTTWRSVWNYSDGRIVEYYVFGIKGGSATITCYPDGSYHYQQANDHFSSQIGQIWEGPEGNGYTEATGTGNPETGEYLFHSCSGFENGAYFENTYRSDGSLSGRTDTYPDGSHETRSFFENGQMESLKRESAEGYYEEQLTQDGTFVYRKFADPGMANVREVFYTDGTPVKVIIDGVVHEDQQTLSQFG